LQLMGDIENVRFGLDGRNGRRAGRLDAGVVRGKVDGINVEGGHAMPIPITAPHIYSRLYSYSTGLSVGCDGSQQYLYKLFIKKSQDFLLIVSTFRIIFFYLAN
jgi:hypothetical protein